MVHEKTAFNSPETKVMCQALLFFVRYFELHIQSSKWSQSFSWSISWRSKIHKSKQPYARAHRNWFFRALSQALMWALLYFPALHPFILSKAIKTLMKAFLSPLTINNQELRQALSLFFQMYSYSSPENQRRMGEVTNSLKLLIKFPNTLFTRFLSLSFWISAKIENLPGNPMMD